MITKTVKKFYDENRKEHTSSLYRNIGHSAKYALSDAKQQAFVHHNWDDLVDSGQLRIRFEQDETYNFEFMSGDTYDIDLNKDTVNGGARTIEAQRKAELAQLEQDGAWVYIVEKKCSCCDNWEHVDSCGGFVGTVPSSEYLWAQSEAIKAVKNENN